MADLARAVACLRVIGEGLIPAEVSVLLGCEPTRGWLMGDTVKSHGATRIARVGLWSLDAAQTEPADLDAQVTGILGRLTTDARVWHTSSVSYDVNLFCGWFMRYANEGVSIGAETMAALATRDITLDIDLYSGDGEEVPDYSLQ